MVLWSLAIVLAGLTVLVASGAVQVRRYSRGHITGQFAVRGHGLYFSRTPDGTWWKVRLVPRRRTCAGQGDWSDPPPDSGVREPRRPSGPGPDASTIELGPPS